MFCRLEADREHARSRGQTRPPPTGAAAHLSKNYDAHVFLLKAVCECAGSGAAPPARIPPYPSPLRVARVCVQRPPAADERGELLGRRRCRVCVRPQLGCQSVMG